ncbi:MAG TPA: aldo/keto reductase [Chitinophagaceae bacterium]|nr:aldo/keto reductase [Chitinophagaceae bacterium]
MSLNEIHTDYIDVLLIHRPDPLLNPQEVAEAITILQQQGKILGGGILSDDTHPRYRGIAACSAELAAKYLTGINQILIAFLLAHPSGIIPILDTTKIECLLQAKEAANIMLEREDWFKLYVASTGEDVA